jgi:hypothetical protein
MVAIWSGRGGIDHNVHRVSSEIYSYASFDSFCSANTGWENSPVRTGICTGIAAKAEVSESEGDVVLASAAECPGGTGGQRWTLGATAALGRIHARHDVIPEPAGPLLHPAAPLDAPAQPPRARPPSPWARPPLLFLLDRSGMLPGSTTFHAL